MSTFEELEVLWPLAKASQRYKTGKYSEKEINELLEMVRYMLEEDRGEHGIGWITSMNIKVHLWGYLRKKEAGPDLKIIIGGKSD